MTRVNKNNERTKMKLETLNRKVSWMLIAVAGSILLVGSQQHKINYQRSVIEALSKDVCRLQSLAYPAVASFRQPFEKGVQP